MLLHNSTSHRSARRGKAKGFRLGGLILFVIPAQTGASPQLALIKR